MESSLRGVPSAYHPPDLMDIVFAFTGRIFETNNIVGAGFSSFFLSTLIYMISGVFSRIFSKTYNQLSIKDQHRWNAGINRGICGLILATRGLLSLLRGIPEGGLAWGTNLFLNQTAAFALGFFLFEIRDSMNMYLAHGIVEETLIVHHTAGVLLYMTAAFYPAYMYLITVVLIQEFCAPMVHFGWMLTKCGMKMHWVWEVNQYLLLVVWVVFRMGTDLVLWYFVLTNFREFIFAGPTLYMLFILSGMILLSVILNPFWFQTKCKQFNLRNTSSASPEQRKIKI
eukprot:m.22541 g.22541  ORF g.22541 m.22541 type:complete len:284 (+) comp7409_c0_seq4:115-966(+)